MKKITCVYKGSPLRLFIKDKKGKEIMDFSYGKVLSEKDVDNKDFEESYKKGRIRSFIKKGWILDKEVNVKNKITGTPHDMKKIDDKQKGVTSETADNYMGQNKNEKTIEEKMEEEAKRMGIKSKKEKTEEKLKSKKRGRPKKKVNESLKKNKEVEEIEAKETEKKENNENKENSEDDFL